MPEEPMSTISLRLLSVPFNGILVRYRASYHAKAAVDVLVFTLFWPLMDARKVYLSPSPRYTVVGLESHLRVAIHHFPSTVIRYACVVGVALLGTIIIAPLEVMATRLALQRNYGGPAFLDTPPTEEAQAPNVIEEKAAYPVDKPVQVPPAPQTVETVPTVANTDPERGLAIESNDIVVQGVQVFLIRPPSLMDPSLRSENEPYSGLVDCFKKICAEEGWPVLVSHVVLSSPGKFRVIVDRLRKHARRLLSMDQRGHLVRWM
ncbi:hypothetical protein DFH07DRAFT_939584 [Mycena maculata]|uniref:Uncharacterized protein n=1 Tax=Mycena maculata TaxID=230809 RepID=A0AAD7NIW5_9AGAR|nr:hypothetical protein DFH07DRAFT_939584 [Mycena maculata]